MLSRKTNSRAKVIDMATDPMFIPHNVPSFKNGKINGKFAGKTTQQYLAKFGIKTFSSRQKTVTSVHGVQGNRFCLFPFDEIRVRFDAYRELFPGMPIFCGFHFVRASRRASDFNNLTHILTDLLVAGDVIVDDDMKHFYPVPLARDKAYVSYDKNHPGVWLQTLPAYISPILR